MIGWVEVYKVVTAMVPLYVPLALGYGSVKWWHILKPEQCDTINRFNCYFILPFFSFDFVTHINPYQMNYRFIFAEIISKFIIAIVLVLWANLSSKGSFSWSISSFSLSSLNNTLVVGVPLLKAMYGQMGADLTIQSYVMQSILWYPSLLFLLEFRRMKKEVSMDSISGDHSRVHSIEGERDLEENTSPVLVKEHVSFWNLVKIVLLKVARNPNCFACVISLVWALLANRWHFEMPKIVEGCILIMSKAGAGVSMFSIGLFMALQEKVIACGANLALFGMVLRFIAGPATVAIGSATVGLRGDVLRAAFIQAALPQAITTFVFAKEYGLHASVFSTAIIFGTMISLPVLIAYYAILEVLP